MDDYAMGSVRVAIPVPRDLRGTLYAVGPSNEPRADGSAESRLLAQGSVLAVRFEEGRVSTAYRVVRTPSWDAERRAGKLLFRSFTAPASNPLWARRRGWHPANGGLLVRGAELVAVGPTGAPITLDRESLESRGPAALDDVTDAFVAPPGRVASRAASYAVTQGRRGLALRSFPEGRPAALLARFPTERCHPRRLCAFTDRYAILIEPPLVIEGGWPGPADVPLRSALRWLPELGTRILVVPLDAPSAAYDLRIDASMTFDIVAAREVSAGRLTVDVTAHHDPWSSLAWASATTIADHEPRWRATLHRLQIDLRGEHAELVALGGTPVIGVSYCPEQRWPLALAWSRPSGDGALPDALLRFDETTGDVHRVPVEAGALFGATPVSRPGRGRYVLALAADDDSGGAARVCVIDGEQGMSVVGVVELPWPIPWRVHGLFCPEEA